MEETALLETTVENPVIKKRPYYNWKPSKVRQLKECYLFMTDRELAAMFGTTPDAIEIRRRRLKLKRDVIAPPEEPAPVVPEPVALKPVRKPSMTKLFLEDEKKYLVPTLEIVQELRPLVRSGKYNQVTKRLDEVPYEQYSYMLEKCDPPKKTLRDCLTASLRWIFRVLDARSDKVNVRDLQMLEESMENKCRYC